MSVVWTGITEDDNSEKHLESGSRRSLQLQLSNRDASRSSLLAPICGMQYGAARF